jgi:predicted secreted protein
MSSKIKGMSNTMKDRILDTAGFTTVVDSQGDEDFRYKTMDYINVFTDDDKEKHNLRENLVITYSSKRAKKDRKDRERLIEKAKKQLETPEKISEMNRRGYRKFLSQIASESEEEANKVIAWELALEKIEQDAKFDGFYGMVQASKANSNTKKMLRHYQSTIQNAINIV